MVLLVALIGFPNLGSRLLTHLHDKATTTPDLDWGTFVEGLKPQEEQERLFNKAAKNLTALEAENWRVLANALDRIHGAAREHGCELPNAVSEWRHWMVLIGRLSFPAGSVVARLQRSS